MINFQGKSIPEAKQLWTDLVKPVKYNYYGPIFDWFYSNADAEEQNRLASIFGDITVEWNEPDENYSNKHTTGNFSDNFQSSGDTGLYIFKPGTSPLTPLGGPDGDTVVGVKKEQSIFSPDEGWKPLREATSEDMSLPELKNYNEPDE